MISLSSARFISSFIELRAAAEVERLVHAVTECEDHAAALLEQELVDRPVDRVPQRRRAVSLQIAAQESGQACRGPT